MEQSAERLGTTIAGKYKLERLLGRGGGASVFLATQLAIGRSVAVKLLHPQIVADAASKMGSDRFEREARLISQLQHPNTITIYDYGEDAGELYLVMEYIEGPSLQALIKEQGRFEPARVASFGQDILRSIEEAHHFGILHRDLKPANIMITRNFKGKAQAKVVDFGIAKLLNNDQREHGDLTQENAFVGTPRYSPPEQILAHDLTPAADLYGVGMIMWQMLMGKPAVATSQVKDCLRAHLSRQPWTLPKEANIPRGLAMIIESALIKDPRHRYQHASDMLQDLERWIADPTISPAKLSAPPVPDHEGDDEDFWDFSSPQMIDPNVGHTSELLGMIIDAQGAPSHHDQPNTDHDATFVFSNTPQARPASRPYHATQPQQWSIDDSPHTPIISLADVSSSSQSADGLAIGRAAQASLAASKRTSPELPASPMSPAARSSELLISPSMRRSPPQARKNTKLLIGGIVAAALLCAGVTAAVFSQRKETPLPLPETSAARTLAPITPITPSAPQTPKEPSSKFSVEGLELVLKSAGWRVEQRSELLDLESYRQHTVLMSKGKSKIEVTFYQTKDPQLIRQLEQELHARDSLERFEDKILKIHPRDHSSSQSFGPTRELLGRYRKLVLAGQSPLGSTVAGSISKPKLP